MPHALLASAAALAALAISGSPAEAQGFGTGLSAAQGRSVAGGTFESPRVGRGEVGIGDPRFDRRRFNGTVVLGPWGWSDRDAGRTWEPNSYNDWWHEQPWRSYPRWMANNGNCERRYWSGGGWRC